LAQALPRHKLLVRAVRLRLRGAIASVGFKRRNGDLLMPSQNPKLSARPVRLIVAGLALVLTVSGCAQLKGRQGYVVDPVLTTSVAPGVDNRESVEKTLGRPTFVGQFSDNEYYYVSRETRQLAFARPRPVAQQVLRVRFDPAGNVVAVDKTGLELVSKINPEGDKTPTLGRHRSFFEDIFGNIGAVGAPGVGGGGSQGQ
jgi:outer membrane protein assembly factor BamE (lipoprotein component of BamABCDE complex)